MTPSRLKFKRASQIAAIHFLLSITQIFGLLHSNVHSKLDVCLLPVSQLNTRSTTHNNFRNSHVLHARRYPNRRSNRNPNPFQRFLEEAQRLINPNDKRNGSRLTPYRPNTPVSYTSRYPTAYRSNDSNAGYARVEMREDRSISNMFNTQYTNANEPMSKTALRQRMKQQRNQLRNQRRNQRRKQNNYQSNKLSLNQRNNQRNKLSLNQRNNQRSNLSVNQRNGQRNVQRNRLSGNQRNNQRNVQRNRLSGNQRNNQRYNRSLNQRNDSRTLSTNARRNTPYNPQRSLQGTVPSNIQTYSENNTQQRSRNNFMNTSNLFSSRYVRSSQELFDQIDNIRVQGGGCLKTCSLPEGVERATVLMKTDGGPLYSQVELWRGPSIPQKIGVYLEDGRINPFRALIETPSSTNTVAIRNVGSVEFPLTTGVEMDTRGAEVGGAGRDLFDFKKTVQGNSNTANTFDPGVQSVLVTLRSDGRPIDAKVELLQGHGTNRQEMNVYSENGKIYPFHVIIETPGPGCTVRVCNTGPNELPLEVSMKPYIVGQDNDWAYSIAPFTSMIGDQIPSMRIR